MKGGLILRSSNLKNSLKEDKAWTLFSWFIKPGISNIKIEWYEGITVYKSQVLFVDAPGSFSLWLHRNSRETYRSWFLPIGVFQDVYRGTEFAFVCVDYKKIIPHQK